MATWGALVGVGLAIATSLLAFRRPARAIVTLAGATALAVVPFAVGAVIFEVAPHVYEMPEHLCPFCLFKSDAYFIGYPLFGAVFLAATWGLGAAAAALFAGRRAYAHGLSRVCALPNGSAGVRLGARARDRRRAGCALRGVVARGVALPMSPAPGTLRSRCFSWRRRCCSRSRASAPKLCDVWHEDRSRVALGELRDGRRQGTGVRHAELRASPRGERQAGRVGQARFREYYSQELKPAEELRFVRGSDVIGPMGPDLVPVSEGTARGSRATTTARPRRRPKSRAGRNAVSSLPREDRECTGAHRARGARRAGAEGVCGSSPSPSANPRRPCARRHAAGLRAFGENYAQELVAKASRSAALDGIEWHMIGHLQTNKARHVAPVVAMVHTIDSAHVAVRAR